MITIPDDSQLCYALQALREYEDDTIETRVIAAGNYW
jgi:hypothetical protein